MDTLPALTPADKAAIRRQNKRKAQLARAAVTHFEQASKSKGEPMETLITDLLADLMHLADAEKEDFNDLLRRAHYHYEHEIHQREEW